MHAANLSDFLSTFSFEPGVKPTSGSDPVSPAIAEIQALRQVDVVGAPDGWDRPPPLLHSGELSFGDQLRLPPPAFRDGPAIHGSIRRILAVDTQQLGDRPEVVAKEETMRRLLGALHEANLEIRRRGR
ncbi:MAG: hypothetical protein IPG45_15155 [Deltaproteobacteria bacterium]|jgi:hypothetical protein|nr:hypothetical protein [Deltaproteobacteria bacterium]